MQGGKPDTPVGDLIARVRDLIEQGFQNAYPYPDADRQPPVPIRRGEFGPGTVGCGR